MTAILKILPPIPGKQTRDQAKLWITPIRKGISSGINAISQFIPQKAKARPAPKRATPSQDKLQLGQIKKAYIKLQKSNEESRVRLKNLEKMLSHADLRHSVMLYYQLDSLWLICYQLLVSHQKDLIREFKGKERDKVLDSYRKQQESDSKLVTDRVSRLEQERSQLMVERRTVRLEINVKNKIWHVFSRRSLNLKLDKIDSELAPLDKALAEGKSQQDVLHSALPPKFKGLNVITKRAINTHLIAFAQFYYAYFSAGDISKLVLKVRSKPPAQFNFGSYEKCQKLDRFVQEKKARIKGLSDLRQSVSRQTERILTQTTYSNEKEAVPQIDSVAFMLSMDNFAAKKTETSESSSGMVNVVQDNYWGISKLLLR